MDDRPNEKTAVLLVVTAASFLAPFMIAALNVALPAIGREFAIDAVALGWVVTTYILAAAVFLLPLGRAGDIIGRKKVFLWGLLIYACGSLLSGAAATAGELIAFRVLQGLGAAMGFATGTALLMSVTPAAERGRALGWNVAAVYLGLSLGPSLGGIITDTLGWRAIFLLNGGAGVLLALLTAWRLRGEWAEARGETLDLAGAVIYGVTLVALMAGFSLFPGYRGALLLLVSILAFVLFVRRQRRCPFPLIEIELFTRNAVFAFSNVAALINYAATAAVGFLLSLYLQYAQGYSPRQAGFILIVQPIVMTVCSPLAGRWSDRVAAGVIASVGMLATAAGLFAFCFLERTTSLGFIVAGLAVLGFGFGLFSSPNTNVVMSAVDQRRYGVASGTLATMRLIGQMLSMGIMMLVIALVAGRVQITAAHLDAFLRAVRLSFAIFAVLCLFGIYASIVRTRSRPGMNVAA